MWMLRGVFGYTRLCLQTEGAGAFAIRKKSAELALVFLSMEWQAEELDRAQRQRQSGHFTKRALVIPVELRTT
jgi:hypothetical protein